MLFHTISTPFEAVPVKGASAEILATRNCCGAEDDADPGPGKLGSDPDGQPVDDITR